MASQVHHNNHEHALTLSTSPATSSLSRQPFVFHRKTPFQLQTLEYLYSDDKNPTKSRLEDYASALGLTYDQARTWFIGRRRRDEQNAQRARGGKDSARIKMMNKKRLPTVEPTEDRDSVRRPGLVQDMLYSPDYILRKIFRKDGPPLGVEFDFLPSNAFQGHSDVTDNRFSDTSVQDEHSAWKRRKVSRAGVFDIQRQCQTIPTMKHGKGKGLMSDWHLVNSDGVNYNTACPVNARMSKKRKALSSRSNAPARRHGLGKGFMIGTQPVVLVSRDIQERRPQRRKKSAAHRRRPLNKVQDKRKPPVRKRKVQSSCKEDQKAHRDICKLALDVENYEGSMCCFSGLADDEELELRDLQAGPNALACSSHLVIGGSQGCSLCKGLLPKFPPNSVSMRKPLSMHPWGSSLKLEKKFFKVFHFLYTYAVTLDLCPFTLDEFAEAFTAKESSLLGKVHISLLQLLLCDVDKELSSEFSIHSNKNGMFLKLLNVADNQRSVLHYWKTSLNALTWTEILRQVMVAAGFGLKDSIQKKGCIDKVTEHMVQYGLHPGTLKAELFKILLERGNTGIKVTELAKSSQIVDLGLGKPDGELEDSICSTLAGDITLFEKIAPLTYRLRPSSIMKEDEDAQSDVEACGGIDDESNEYGIVGINYSECDSGCLTSRPDTVHQSGGDNQLILCSEIDESQQGESWLIGLMEGEYSDLSIDEKLNALLALLDLSSAGSSVELKDPLMALGENVPKVFQHGSGGKIKRSAPREPRMLSSLGNFYEAKEEYQSSEFNPVDSSVALSVLFKKASSTKEESTCLHPMQSIFLGSDRRYNRYWIFLGPCDADDPGHSRVYFESSEDGQWQVIDSQEALCGIVGALNSDGRREASLLASLEKRMMFILSEMSSRVVVQANIGHFMQADVSEMDRAHEDGTSPISIIDNNLSFAGTPRSAAISSDIAVNANKKAEVQKHTYAHLRAYDLWIWDCFYNALHTVKSGKQSYADSLTRCRSCHDLYWRDERHCQICHTTFELDFDLEEKYAIHMATCQAPDDADMCPTHKVLPSRLQALKAAVHAIELLMPEDALIGAWKKSAHKLWVRRLRRTSSLHELLQVLTDFAGAMNVNWLSQCDWALHCDSTLKNTVECFLSIPKTSSAVALWLVKLDCLIAPSLNQGMDVQLPAL